MTKKEKWLTERKKNLTSTDMAAVLGVSRYKSPIDVWLEKTNRDEPITETEPMKWGNRLQVPILQEYEEVTSRKLKYADQYDLMRNSAFPILASSFDSFTKHSLTPVDAKNVRIKRPEWGEPGSDLIPHEYLIQLHVQMIVSGAKSAELAVLFGGQQFEIFQTIRDNDLVGIIIGTAEQFWRDYVVTDRMPPVDGSDRCREYLQGIKHKTSNLIGSTNRLDDIAFALLSVRKKIELLETEKTYYENTLKEAIGENEGIVGEKFRATWKTSKETMATDWKGIVTELKPPLDVIKTYTQTKPGSRRFLFHYEEEK